MKGSHQSVQTVRKIAVLNFGGLGDNILFLPVITALKALCPDSHVSWITETRSRGIQDLLPQQVDVIFIATQGQSRIKLFLQLWKLLTQQKFDAVLSSGSSPFISLLLALTGIHIRIGYETGCLSKLLLTQAAPLYLNAYAAEMHFELAKAFAAVLKKSINDNIIAPKVTENVLKKLPPIDLPPKKWLAIHPGVSLASIQKNILKGWQPEKWCQLVQEIITRYPEHTILLLGGPDDEAIIQAIQVQLSTEQARQIYNYAGKTNTVGELASTLKQVELLVCVDSAPMHLAVALGVPIIALFAPTDPFKLLPGDIATQTVRRMDLPCQPCLFDKRMTSCDMPTCQDIPVDEVMSAISKMM